MEEEADSKKVAAKKLAEKAAVDELNALNKENAALLKLKKAKDEAAALIKASKLKALTEENAKLQKAKEVKDAADAH